MSSPVFDPLDVPVSRHTNNSGSPLPIIPRRNSNLSSRPLVSKSSTPPKQTESPVQITLQQATPPEDNKIASSSKPRRQPSPAASDPSRLSPTSPKRRPSLTPSEPATPTPRQKDTRPFPSLENTPLDDATPKPSSLAGLSRKKLNTAVVIPRTYSEYQARYIVSPPPPLSLTISTSEISLPPSVIRKKSGQLVKPSLKRSSFSGAIPGLPGVSTKSEPTTPTVAKAVKFDRRLEQVKLFIAEQKPLAVSRDGSPTDDTDSDFPDFIYGKDDKTILTMNVVNMPSIINLSADVIVEELKLLSETTTIVGRIRVRNLAYQKWVAARFTLDNWQTTSEVTAKYVESAQGGVDIFSFSIKLADLLAKIEEKKMMLAIRYAVNGMELWDNNQGRNYTITFSKELPKPVSRRRIPSDESSGSDISDLRSRLEQVVHNQETTGAPTSKSTPPDFKSGDSFATRYGFQSSYKEPWVPPSPAPLYATYRHSRMYSHPVLPTFTQKTASKRPKPMDSPRVFEETFRPAPFVPSEDEDGAIPFPPKNRNHQRGYFDTKNGPFGLGFKMTPPTPPESLSLSTSDDVLVTMTPRGSSGGYFSLSPTELTPRALIPLGTDSASSASGLLMPGSLTDTPSLMSPTSSSGASSPSTDEFVSTLTAALSGDLSANTRTDYHEFLNKFCFYTGDTESGASSSSEANSPPEGLSRSSSPSSADQVFNTTSPRLSGFAFGPGPHFSPAQSGSETPTSIASSRCPTPVAAA